MPLWRYAAHVLGETVEVTPIVAETAAEAFEIARTAYSEGANGGRAIRAEHLGTISCTTPDCRGTAETDNAGRYLCAACSAWYAPGLFD